MKRILILLILCLPLRAAVITIEADDYTPGESMNNPVYGIWLFCAGNYDIEFALKTLKDKVAAVESSNPDKPLGENVIGRSDSPSDYLNDYWYSSGSDPIISYLFLEIHNSARRITIDSARKPGVQFKTLITKMYDANGLRVAYNFTSSSILATDVGSYKIRYAIFYVSSVRSLDHIIIDYQPIPTFSEFADRWLYECSIDGAWCEGCDINHDGIVNFKDYSRFCLNEWLEAP